MPHHLCCHTAAAQAAQPAQAPLPLRLLLLGAAPPAQDRIPAPATLPVRSQAPVPQRLRRAMALPVLHYSWARLGRHRSHALSPHRSRAASQPCRQHRMQRLHLQRVVQRMQPQDLEQRMQPQHQELHLQGLQPQATP